MTTAKTTARRLLPFVAASALVLPAACSAGSAEGDAAQGEGGEAITVENCGEELTVDRPVSRLLAYDGGIISIALAVGAREELTSVAGIGRDRDVLALKYGEGVVDGLDEVSPQGPSMENIVAAQPELVFMGWGYGFDESKNLTPDGLADRDIATYVLSETCRQDDGARGTMEPWTALSSDLRNIGELTGHEDQAAEVVADIDARREALAAAPKGEERTAYLFDSARDAIFTSGSFGGPQAIFDAAGVRNAAEDVEDTWTEVSWERLATADPDIIYFVDYPGQSYEEKVAALEANPSSRDLEAVRKKRYVNLPYALWVSSPLNIDAAELVRVSMEGYGLAPRSGITPQLDLTKLADLPGNDWLRD